MNNSKIIETLNSNTVAFSLLGANLLLLWIPIDTFILSPKIIHYVIIYLVFILGANSYTTIKNLFNFPGSTGEPIIYFETTKFILSLSSLMFFTLWFFKNRQMANSVYSALIILVIIVYFIEIIRYPKVLRSNTQKQRKQNALWQKQKENAKSKEKNRWGNLTSEQRCNEICQNIKYYIDENHLKNADSLIDEWKDEIIDFKGNNYYNNLINSYNNRAKQNRKENKRENSRIYNWQCSECNMLVTQRDKPSGKCNSYNSHRWNRL